MKSGRSTRASCEQTEVCESTAEHSAVHGCSSKPQREGTAASALVTHVNAVMPRAQPCPTLGNLMDCSPPGSSVHGILQAIIPEQVAISFFGGSPQHRIKPPSPALASGFLTSEPSDKPD